MGPELDGSGMALPASRHERRVMPIASRLGGIADAWKLEVERVGRQLAVRHPPGAGGTLRVWFDDAGRLLVRIDLAIVPTLPRSPPASQLKRGPRKRALAAEAHAKSHPPQPIPWASGAVVVAPPKEGTP